MTATLRPQEFGLILLVRTAAPGHTTKCWTESFPIDHRHTRSGLRRYPIVALALARQMTLENAQAIAEGCSPAVEPGNGADLPRSLREGEFARVTTNPQIRRSTFRAVYIGENKDMKKRLRAGHRLRCVVFRRRHSLRLGGWTVTDPI